MNEHEEYIHDEYGPPKPWLSPLVWSALGLLAFIVYEATMQPALASAMLCVKFGWEDFRTAFWLKRKDPYRPRGKACRALYLASGLWRVSISATALFFVFIAIEAKPAPRPQAGQPNAAGAALVPFLTAFFGYCLLALTTCRALGLALYHGIKFWLDPAVHRARRQQIWPPSLVCKEKLNRINGLLLVAMFVIFFPLVLLAIIAGAIIANAILGPIQFVVGIGGLSAGTFGIPIAMLALKDFICRRIVARTPDECWERLELIEPGQPSE
jgi:hypothetical protein